MDLAEGSDVYFESSSDPDNDSTYDVEHILAEHIEDDGIIRYLIKWKGYAVERATWEPVESFQDGGKQILRQWEKRQKEIKRGTEPPFNVDKWKELCDIRRTQLNLRRQQRAAAKELAANSRQPKRVDPVKAAEARAAVTSERDQTVDSNDDKEKSSDGNTIDDAGPRQAHPRKIAPLRRRQPIIPSSSDDEAEEALTAANPASLLSKPTFNFDEKSEKGPITWVDPASTNVFRNIGQTPKARQRTKPELSRDSSGQQFKYLSERRRFEKFSLNDRLPALNDNTAFPFATAKKHNIGKFNPQGTAPNTASAPGTPFAPVEPYAVTSFYFTNEKGESELYLKVALTCWQWYTAGHVCEQGDLNCPFFHADRFPLADANRFIPPKFHPIKPETCFYWWNHQCKNSDEDCTYAHHNTGYVASVPGKRGEPTKVPLNAIPPGQKSHWTCHYWWTGACNKSAETCKYAHFNTGTLAPSPFNPSDKPIEIDPSLDRPTEAVKKAQAMKMQTCMFWAKGHCKFTADDCKYAHEAKEPVGVPPNFNPAPAIDTGEPLSEVVEEAPAAPEDIFDSDEALPVPPPEITPLTAEELTEKVMQEIASAFSGEDEPSAAVIPDTSATPEPYTPAAYDSPVEDDPDLPRDCRSWVQLLRSLKLPNDDPSKDTWLQALFRRKYGLTYDFIFRGQNLPPGVLLDKEVFLIADPVSEPQYINMMTMWLQHAGATVYTLRKPGSWAWFAKNIKRGVVIHSSAWSDWEHLPHLREVLLKNILFYEISFGKLDRPKRDRNHGGRWVPEFVIKRVWPLGSMIFLTDEMIINCPQQTMEIMHRFRVRHVEQLNDTWKLMFRPSFENWLVKLMEDARARNPKFDRTNKDDWFDDRETNDLKWMLMCLNMICPGSERCAWSLEDPAPHLNARVISDRSDETSARYLGGFDGSSDCSYEIYRQFILEYMGWNTLAYRHEFRRCIMVHPAPRPEWNKWEHFWIVTPEKLLSTFLA